MLSISVYDSSLVRDRGGISVGLSDFDIYQIEFVIADEYRATPDLTRTISKYESVSAADVLTVGNTLEVIWGMEDRTSGWPRLPVRELSASFIPSFSTKSNLKIPVSAAQGYFGGSLSKRTPAYTVEAYALQDSYPLTGSGKLPTRSLTGYFGGYASGKIPVLQITATLSTDTTLRLSKQIPVRSLEAEFTPETAFSLDAKIPVWNISIDLETGSIGMTLDSRIPGAFVFSGSGYLNGGISLDENIPVRRLTASMDSLVMSLDAKIPVWIVEEVNDARLQHLTRFSDYVLRYVRP